ncbi:MAG: tRNA (adenosine(37)-N6)-threonylcarbamoyltransferase complex dimerization subunit type 1 TsaB [Candidatus Omnitrophica bacterium]|nr:tRNA (adenosine(37)-N6)-threonylcarbamoyltransferase complex dimerization subunit type 1 TsaB [Candidatus Omnitrophota bacterium]
MKWLGIETSCPAFSVAVSDGERILSCLQGEGRGRPSSLLTDLIQQALRQAGMELAQVDGLAISIGPGSFTGLRVGVMTAKTMAWALRKPVQPVSSLEAIAQNLAPPPAVSAGGGVAASPRDVLAFVDARKGNVYSALFSPAGDGQLARATEDERMLPAEALERVPASAVVVGDGLQAYGPLLAQASTEAQLEPAPADLWFPRADSVCRLADCQWPRGRVDDPHRLVPKYLYSKESDITRPPEGGGVTGR